MHMDILKPPYDNVNNLRPLYDDYIAYKHAKTDVERKEAIDKLLKVHNLDIVKLEDEI